jgi:hypothetical protein
MMGRETFPFRLRDARDRRDWRERRDQKFEVLKTSNFGPRTLTCLAHPARPARLAGLSAAGVWLWQLAGQ